jgi:ABC-type nitrate/sulfonate/bicarbonate transport system substrate-binding protein
MAEFKIEIADADVGRVLTAVASNYNRPEKVIIDEEEVDNPETVAQFANRMVREFLSENVKAYEIRLAKEQAANSVDTSVTINDPAV